MAKRKPVRLPPKREPKPRRLESRRGEPPAEIAVIGELFEESETDIIKSLLDVEPGGEATLYIDSAGGNVYSALAIASLLHARKLRTTAIVLGECSSSTILVFAACQRRVVTPRSVFLFHRVKWRSDKDCRTEEAASWAHHFQWLEKEIDRYQAELLGGDPQRIARWIDSSRFVLGPELVELGLAEMLEV